MSEDYERLRAICDEWGVDLDGVRPDEAVAAVAALRAAVGAGSATEVRAAQVILLAGRGGELRKRPALRQLAAAVEPLARYQKEALLLRALILVGWPAEAGRLAGLLDAGWEAHVEGDAPRAEIDGWRRRMRRTESTGSVGATNQTTMKGLASAARTDVKAQAVASYVEASGAPGVVQAWASLVNNVNTGWRFDGFSSQLLLVLDALIADLHTIGRGNGPTEKALATAAEPLEWLRKNKTTAWDYNSYASQLVKLLDALELAAVGCGVPSARGPQMDALRNHAGQAYQFNNFGVWLVHVLNTWRGALRVGLQLRATTDGLTTLAAALAAQEKRLQTWAASTQASFETALTSLDTRISAARPPELDLLWWGQAGWSPTAGAPYRKLTESRALWLAAAEAASFCERLPAEPAAAYLVSTLARWAQPINASMEIRQWLREGYAALRTNDLAPVRPALAMLATEDPAGLPITWVRLRAGTGHPPTDEEVRERIGIDPAAPLDRGEWATWIFRELLLERLLG